MKKILATILATALGLGAWGAEHSIASNEALAAAFDDGTIQSGDVINLAAGSYRLQGMTGAAKNKTLTFVGAGAAATTFVVGDGTTYGSDGPCDYSLEGSTVTFKNLTVSEYKGSENYQGFVRSASLTFDNVTFEGRTSYWGIGPVVFTNCTFNAPGSDYALWTWSGSSFSFTGCVFNCAGKGMHLYRNTYTDSYDVTVTGCTFNSTVANKAAIVVKCVKGDGSIVNLTTSNNTVSGFNVNATTGTDLYQTNGTGKQDSGATVTVNGEVVYATKEGVGTVVVFAPAAGAADPVTFSVRSVNLFGSIKVTGVASNMFVAVPFEGFDGNAMPASNVVHAANMADNTKMYVWKGTEYSVYESASGKWTTPNKITVTEDGATVGTADLATAVAAGTGVILQRPGNSGNVYVYGQLPATTAGTVSFGAGQTLVSALSTNAMADVNLNAFTWTGVKATTKKRLKGQAGADYIQFRDKNNNLVKYYYLEGEGWGVVPTQVTQFSDLVSGGKALVPAGTAFWYYSSAGGAQLDWGE